MARILELRPSSQQQISPHKIENGVVCEWKLIRDTNGAPLVHLSTFGSKNRQADPKSSQSIQVDEGTARELIAVLGKAFDEAKLQSHEVVLPGSDDQVSPPDSASLPDADGALVDATNMPLDWLQETIDLLRDRPQLILYGPPGTGKTFLASKLANHIAPAANIKMVQFHPSYSYEDFFEGFRPAGSESGDLEFELRAGPLRLISERARARPDETFVLLVDEVNRGNLSKIFGELYFLLEYRDQAIDLMYATRDSEPFTLPSNVILLGTMNSVDRSVAVVDSAMRRRFSFVSLRPDDYPVRESLRAWLQRQGQPIELAKLLDALNESIDDDDFKVGPSYFMRNAIYVPGGLLRMWNTSIIPLLLEYRHGATVAEIKDQFAIAKFLRVIGESLTSLEEKYPTQRSVS
jgi:5-methylcytosine-specific restriction protein B